MSSIRAALYALKLTVGSTSCEGVFRICETFDAQGIMTKSVVNLHLLMDVLLQTEGPDSDFLERT
jgi:Asp-tRNA(Asn)/Glu-tRNA(Gln) amidotransferase A subunit family amidase